MLRITTHDNPESLTFQLEGRLAGPWVREFEACWQNSMANQPKRVIRVDLMGVTFIDASGREFLAALHTQGAHFVCTGCLMRAIVAEITA